MSKKGRELVTRQARDLGPMGVLRSIVTALDKPEALSAYRARRGATFSHEIAMSYDLAEAVEMALGPMSESKAERCERGALINLDTENFHTDLYEVGPDGKRVAS